MIEPVHSIFSSVRSSSVYHGLLHTQQATFSNFTKKFTTQSQLVWSFESQGVSKILTACRMLQISIAQRQMKAKIHSFPTMYILGGGVDVVEMGQIKVFDQK